MGEESVEKRLIKKNDIILLSALSLIFAAIMLFLLLTGSDGSEVVVSIDGAEAYSFPLDEELEYEIVGYEGGTNYLVIENGEAYLKDASCPDRLCVHMGRISRAGQSIICLPNRIVIEIRSKDDEFNEHDAVVG